MVLERELQSALDEPRLKDIEQHDKMVDDQPLAELPAVEVPADQALDAEEATEVLFEFFSNGTDGDVVLSRQALEAFLRCRDRGLLFW